MAEQFQKLILTELRTKPEEEAMNQMANNAVKQLKHSDFQNINSVTNINISPDNKTKKKETDVRSRVSTGKVFVARQSLLTELLVIPHIRTIHHIFIVILIILFLNTVIYDLVDTGSINLGIGLIRLGFGKFGTVLYLWSCMQMAALLPHPLLRLWAVYRQHFNPFGNAVFIWDIAWICMLVAFQVTFMVLPTCAVLKHNLPIASSLIVLMEMVRFIMKIHSYVRSVSPRALHHFSSSSSTQLQTTIPLPPFSCYLYFLFAPTLIYRDCYPRTTHTRWGVVAARMLEVILIIFFKSFLYQRFFFASFSNFGKADEIIEAKQIVLLIFSAMLPSLMLHIITFYLVLHCWLNVTAEVLTFADRQFYTDWWTQTNYTNYYRTWNVVIHDWLYTYIYKDMIILTRHRLFSTLLVFTVSAIIHEFILSFTFRFFYPILLVFFGVFGVLLAFLMKQSKSSMGNIFMWWTLAVGNGIMYCMYCAEYFARRNCPSSGETGIWDVLIPRSWSCHHIILRPDWKFQNPIYM